MIYFFLQAINEAGIVLNTNELKSNESTPETSQNINPQEETHDNKTSQFTLLKRLGSRLLCVSRSSDPFKVFVSAASIAKLEWTDNREFLNDKLMLAANASLKKQLIAKKIFVINSFDTNKYVKMMKGAVAKRHLVSSSNYSNEIDNLAILIFQMCANLH